MWNNQINISNGDLRVRRRKRQVVRTFCERKIPELRHKFEIDIFEIEKRFLVMGRICEFHVLYIFNATSILNDCVQFNWRWSSNFKEAITE